MNNPEPHPLEDWQQEVANDDRANPMARPDLPPAAMLRLAAGEAAEWLRRGAPGRALEAIERGLKIFDNSKGW